MHRQSRPRMKLSAEGEQPPHPSLSHQWGERVAQSWRGTAAAYPKLGEAGSRVARLLPVSQSFFIM